MPLLDKVRRTPAAFEYECRRCHAVFLAAPDAVRCPHCSSTDVGAFVP